MTRGSMERIGGGLFLAGALFFAAELGLAVAHLVRRTGQHEPSGSGSASLLLLSLGFLATWLARYRSEAPLPQTRAPTRPVAP